MNETTDNTMSVLNRTSGLDNKKKHEVVLCISFNQDKSCVAIGTNFGYKIFNCKNFNKVGERDLDMPICRIQMLYRSNLVMLVKGSAENHRIPDTTIMFYDDKMNETTGELDLKYNINKLKMRKDSIYILHDNQLQVFSLESMQVTRRIETRLNPYSIFACSYHENTRLVAYPSPDRDSGFFTVKNLANDKQMVIDAHSHDIECIDMDYNGTVIASASKKGTIIRVFRLKDGSVLQEFRRGIDNAKIMSITLDVSGTLLGLSSDSGTVHIYSINNPDVDSKEGSLAASSSAFSERSAGGSTALDINNKKSRFSFLKKAIKYFDSEWSSLQLKVDEKIVFVNFNSDSSEILVYKSTGKFWKYDMSTHFEKNKGKKKVELTDCVRLLG